MIGKCFRRRYKAGIGGGPGRSDGVEVLVDVRASLACSLGLVN